MKVWIFSCGNAINAILKWLRVIYKIFLLNFTFKSRKQNKYILKLLIMRCRWQSISRWFSAAVFTDARVPLYIWLSEPGDVSAAYRAQHTTETLKLWTRNKDKKIKNMIRTNKNGIVYYNIISFLNPSILLLGQVDFNVIPSIYRYTVAGNIIFQRPRHNIQIVSNNDKNNNNYYFYYYDHHHHEVCITCIPLYTDIQWHEKAPPPLTQDHSVTYRQQVTRRSFTVFKSAKHRTVWKKDPWT